MEMKEEGWQTVALMKELPCGCPVNGWVTHIRVLLNGDGTAVHKDCGRKLANIVRRPVPIQGASR